MAEINYINGYEIADAQAREDIDNIEETYATVAQLNTETTSRQNADDNLQSQINSLASGSPKGVYSTKAALEADNPDTGVYIVTADGHIYSWTKNGSSAIDLGIYQGTGIGENSVSIKSLNDNLKKYINSAQENIIKGGDITKLPFNFINGYHTNNNNKFNYNSDNKWLTTGLLPIQVDGYVFLKPKYGYLMNLTSYTFDGTDYVVKSSKAFIDKEVFISGLDNEYIAISIKENNQSNNLDPNNIFDYIECKTVSKLDEINNLINGYEGSSNSYSETHQININDFEIRDKIKNLYIDNGTISFLNNDSVVYGVVGTKKDKIEINTLINGDGFIIIGEDYINYYGVRLFNSNTKGKLYTITKELASGGALPTTDYFEVNQAWTNLTPASKIKMVKNGNTLSVYGDNQLLFTYNDCNFLGLITAYTLQTNFSNCNITLSHNLGSKGLCEIIENLKNNPTKKEISILFVGNSLTQDGIAYLPYLLKEYYPEVNFKFYMWYNGGYTLAQHYNKFINNNACEIFSVAENNASWTNYNNSKTMSYILSTYKFDIVCLQEYFNYKESYTENDLTDWINCQEYIRQHYNKNSLEFVELFHAPKRDNATNIFNVTKQGNDLILQKTICQDMIPNGIAVYRALSTDLDSLGDQGHLSPDGTHTQEGLPCLLQTYVSLLWLLDKLSINKSIYGCSLRITTDIYNTLNVPGPNLGSGVITGTDEQNILAQEVAIKAYKEGKKEVIDNLF